MSVCLTRSFLLASVMVTGLRDLELHRWLAVNSNAAAASALSSSAQPEPYARVGLEPLDSGHCQQQGFLAGFHSWA